MAFLFTTNIILSLLIIISSNTPQSLSQSNSPQNIQTFYPISSPPPLIPPPPAAIGPPPTTTATPPRRSSTRAAVVRAIGLTAASTIVLSGLIVFFLLVMRSRRRRSAEENAVATTRGGTNPPVPPNDDFTRLNGNIKGLIVDENGLDVIYWKNLQEGEDKASFKKQNYNNLRDEQEQEKRMVSGRERKYNNNNKPPIQKVPLLRGKSSTSQSPIWAENEDQIMKKEPSLFSTNGVSFKAMEKQNSLIQLMKHATPPLPPPPPLAARTATPPLPPPMPSSNNSPTPPPPPPLPQMAVGAVAKMVAAPPPLRPPSGGAPPSLTLKPPPPNKRSSSLGEGTSSDKNEQVKLKPLHWDKVNPNAAEHSMVWDKIDKGSFKFDGDLMEALFGYVATNRKSPRSSLSSPKPPDKSGPPSQIFILDTHKSQNIAIVLKSLGITRKEIIDALIDGQGLNADTIEKLTKIAPSDEEASQITAFDGNPTRLAAAESFLYHLLKSIPSAFTRFNAMLFRSNYDSEASSIKESLKSLELACNELRTRGLFLKLLEAVLKAGNRLNAGTSRGNAQAFNLTALRKLSDVKSSDGKTTLLQFVVQEVVRAEGKRCVLNNKNRSSISRTNSSQRSSSINVVESQISYEQLSKDDREREYMMLGLPVIGGLSAEFSNVKKAATLDYDVLVRTITALSAQVVETREVVWRRCGVNNNNGGGFAREMKGFLDRAEVEIKVMKEDEMRLMEVVKKTRDYYNINNTVDELFVIVRDFLGMVDKVCTDIARNVQRRKLPAAVTSSYNGGAAAAAVGSSSSSSSPESPRVFRFPKLPPNFMSESSQ